MISGTASIPSSHPSIAEVTVGREALEAAVTPAERCAPTKTGELAHTWGIGTR